MNKKDMRIKKLWRKGLTIEQIAKKIGDSQNFDRVQQGIEREVRKNDIIKRR